MHMRDGSKKYAAILATLMLAAQGVFAADLHFVKPGEVDAKTFLPAPPVAGSQEAAAELATVLRLQDSRSDAEVARANSEAKLTPAAFQAVFGTDFTAEHLPLLFSLLMDAAADSKAISDPAKADFNNQPRPQFVDPRVKPSIADETDGSYPSGHASRGILWASILLELAPDKKDAILARGQEIGWDRVLAGVHFPSDIFAGRVLGLTLARVMDKNPAFQDRMAKVKAEWEAFSKAHGAKAPVAG